MWRFQRSKAARSQVDDRSASPGLLRTAAFVGSLLAPVGLAAADVLVLESGGRLEGSIVEANDNIVIVRRPNGGVQQIVRRLISEISVGLNDGRTVEGEFVSWTNGVLELRTDDGTLRIRAGHVLEDGDGNETVEEARGAESTPAQTAGSRRSYVPPPIFTLSSGTTIVGRPIDFQDPLLTIRRASGGQQTLRMSEVIEVVVRDADGGSLAGEFIDWADGVFELRVNQRLVRVAQGAIVNEAEGDTEIGGPLENLPPADGTVQEVAALPDTTTNGEAKQDERPIVVDDTEKILLTVTGEPTNESDREMRFDVSLSRPAPRDLIVIYSTLVGTAGEEDITDGSGIVRIMEGTDTATITIPLVDDAIKEGSESFRLFVSSDPTLIEMEANRITATIEDDD